MDVVARAKGKYGVIRERGDPFTLADGKNDFSTRWMVKAGSEEAKLILRERGTVATLSDLQIAMEEAQATGKSAKATIAAKDAKIAELEKALASVQNAEVSANVEPEAEPEAGAENDADTGEQPEAKDPPQRASRRSRN